MKLMENNYAIPGSSKNGYILVTFSLSTAVEIVTQMFRGQIPEEQRVPEVSVCQNCLPF